MTFLWIQLSHKIEKHDILWKKKCLVDPALLEWENVKTITRWIGDSEGNLKLPFKKMLKVKKFDFFSLVLDERSDVWHS